MALGMWLVAMFYTVTLLLPARLRPLGREPDLRALVSRLGLLGHRRALGAFASWCRRSSPSASWETSRWARRWMPTPICRRPATMGCAMADASASAGYGTLAMLADRDGRLGVAGHAGPKGRRARRLHEGLLSRQPRAGRLGPGADRHRAKRRHLHGLSRRWSTRTAGSWRCGSPATWSCRSPASPCWASASRSFRDAPARSRFPICSTRASATSAWACWRRSSSWSFMTFLMIAQFKAGAIVMKLAWPGSGALALAEGRRDRRHRQCLPRGPGDLLAHRRRLHADRRVSGVGVDRSVSKRADG